MLVGIGVSIVFLRGMLDQIDPENLESLAMTPSPMFTLFQLVIGLYFVMLVGVTYQRLVERNSESEVEPHSRDADD